MSELCRLLTRKVFAKPAILEDVVLYSYVNFFKATRSNQYWPVCNSVAWFVAVHSDKPVTVVPLRVATLNRDKIFCCCYYECTSLSR